MIVALSGCVDVWLIRGQGCTICQSTKRYSLSWNIAARFVRRHLRTASSEDIDVLLVRVHPWTTCQGILMYSCPETFTYGNSGYDFMHGVPRQFAGGLVPAASGPWGGGRALLLTTTHFCKMQD